MVLVTCGHEGGLAKLQVTAFEAKKTGQKAG